MELNPEVHGPQVDFLTHPLVEVVCSLDDASVDGLQLEVVDTETTAGVSVLFLCELIDCSLDSSLESFSVGSSSIASFES